MICKFHLVIIYHKKTKRKCSIMTMKKFQLVSKYANYVIL